MEKRRTGYPRWLYAGFFSVIVLLTFLTGCTSSSPANPVQDAVLQQQSAIIAAAGNCTATSVTINDAVGTFQYTSSEGCVFTKKLMKLNESEMQEMKTMLEGESMTCRYTKGTFDPRLVTSLVGGIEHCTGDLKDDIAELTIFT